MNPDTTESAPELNAAKFLEEHFGCNLDNSELVIVLPSKNICLDIRAVAMLMEKYADLRVSKNIEFQEKNSINKN